MARRSVLRTSKPQNQGPSEIHHSQEALRARLEQLDGMLESLRVQYEQYFSGMVHIAPDSDRKALMREIRALQKEPFANATQRFRLRSVEQRFQTYRSYWERVARAREDGTYDRDVFRADLKDFQAAEIVRRGTKAGIAEQQLKELHQTYQSSLQSVTGTKQKVDYEKFQELLIRQSDQFRQRTGSSRVAFSVVVRDGAVKIVARAA